MADIHETLGLSMEQTRYLLKRIVDGENRLVSDLIMTNPFQLMDVVLCAATMLEAVRRKAPEVFEELFTKVLPD